MYNAGAGSRSRIRALRGAALIAALLLVAVPGAARAYTAAPGYVAENYATGFPENTQNGWGPLGVAFDQSDNLYVADTVDSNIYRFQPGGGVVSPATRLTNTPIPGGITGLAVSKSGDMYLARYHAGDIVQIDPNTGDVLRTIANVPCALGLAIDPISADLFVSQNGCGTTIFRISDFQNGPGTVSSYASAPGVDGLVFDQSGALYARSDQEIMKIDGTNSATPGAITNVAHVSTGDGLAFGAHTSGEPTSLVVNRNDGTVTRVDFGNGPTSETNIFTGGSRGDFAAVDSKGCLYITQSSSIVRISESGNTCAFEPTTRGPAPPPGVIATTVSATTLSPPARGPACVLLHSLRLRLSQRGKVRLKSAAVYVNGKLKKELRGVAVTRPFVLANLPKTSFTVKIVAITTRGKRLIKREFFANCHKPAPACLPTRSLKVRVPQRIGTRIVEVKVYLNGRRKKVVRGARLTTVTLHGLPHARFTVKLLTRDARGRHATKTQTFTGCAASGKHKASAKGTASTGPKVQTGADPPSSCAMAIRMLCVIAAKE